MGLQQWFSTRGENNKNPEFCPTPPRPQEQTLRPKAVGSVERQVRLSQLKGAPGSTWAEVQNGADPLTASTAGNDLAHCVGSTEAGAGHTAAKKLKAHPRPPTAPCMQTQLLHSDIHSFLPPMPY